MKHRITRNRAKQGMPHPARSSSQHHNLLPPGKIPSNCQIFTDVRHIIAANELMIMQVAAYTLPCLIIMSTAVVSTGCGSKQYRPVETNIIAPGEAESDHRPIDKAEADLILQTFGSLASDYQSTSPPTAGPTRGRWQDVAIAADWATIDVEVAILKASESAGAWTFELITLDGEPGELIVRQSADPDRIWDAQAWLGMFPADRVNIARAQKLISAFEDRMQQLSRKPQFVD